MKVNVRMKNLPKEFDFKPNINPLGLAYHAKEMDGHYFVTIGDCEWRINKDNFHKHFVKKEYVVCT